MANFKKNKWQWNGEPYTVQPGEFITSSESIAAAAGRGITPKIVRDSLRRLVKYKIITKVSSNNSTKITILNWSEDQGKIDKKGSHKSPTIPKPDKLPSEGDTTEKPQEEDGLTTIGSDEGNSEVIPKSTIKKDKKEEEGGEPPALLSEIGPLDKEVVTRAWAICQDGPLKTIREMDFIDMLRDYPVADAVKVVKAAASRVRYEVGGRENPWQVLRWEFMNDDAEKLKKNKLTGLSDDDRLAKKNRPLRSWE